MLQLSAYLCGVFHEVYNEDSTDLISRSAQSSKKCTVMNLCGTLMGPGPVDSSNVDVVNDAAERVLRYIPREHPRNTTRLQLVQYSEITKSLHEWDICILEPYRPSLRRR